MNDTSNLLTITLLVSGRAGIHVQHGESRVHALLLPLSQGG